MPMGFGYVAGAGNVILVRGGSVYVVIVVYVVDYSGVVHADDVVCCAGGVRVGEVVVVGGCGDFGVNVVVIVVGVVSGCVVGVAGANGACVVDGLLLYTHQHTCRRQRQHQQQYQHQTPTTHTTIQQHTTTTVT